MIDHILKGDLAELARVTARDFTGVARRCALNLGAICWRHDLAGVAFCLGHVQRALDALRGER